MTSLSPSLNPSLYPSVANVSTAATVQSSNMTNSVASTHNNNSSSNLKLTAKPPCAIYKINLDFLTQSAVKSAEKFNQLCENSSRTIKREISNFTSQFIFTDQEDMPKQYSIYQKIISSNVI